jgi:hypothetical protein
MKSLLNQAKMKVDREVHLGKNMTIQGVLRVEKAWSKGFKRFFSHITLGAWGAPIIETP